MKKPIPKNEESLFQFSELFFSRTDKRGVIQACNRVFTRVSGYQEEEMLGQPHNLVRHPDMPKAVFRLFWDTLKSDQPIVAYVKNLSSDGKYYWVLAAAFPTEDGYVSIRLKPGTPLFHKIKAIYEQIRETENSSETGKPPVDLIEQIKALGFSSYQGMTLQALIEEFENREKQMSQLHAGTLHLNQRQTVIHEKSNLDFILNFAQSVCIKMTETYNIIFKQLMVSTELNTLLTQESQKIKSAYQSVRFLAVNMSIASEQAGAQGHSLTTIASTFERWVKEANTALEKFITSMSQATTRLENASFYAAASRLQLAMINSYVDEIRNQSNQIQANERSHSDLNTFTQMAISIFTIAENHVSDFLRSVRALDSHLSVLQEAMSALYIVRQSGKIEVSQLGTTGGTFIQHLEELGKFTKSVVQCVAKISSAANAVTTSMGDVSNRLLQVKAEFDELNQLQLKRAPLTQNHANPI
jgi:aerotaxis receptor